MTCGWGCVQHKGYVVWQSRGGEEKGLGLGLGLGGWAKLNSSYEYVWPLLCYRYDTFRVEEGASKAKKQVALDSLAESLKKESTTSQVIHVKLPLLDAHQNHNISLNFFFSRHILRDKIYEYVSLRVTSVPFLKQVLKQYV